MLEKVAGGDFPHLRQIIINGQVFFFFFFFVLFCFFFLKAVAGNRCSRDQYKKGDDCLSCASCPPGQEITLNCGHDNKGVTTGEKCKSCSLGSTFSDRNSTDRCTNCLRCEKLYGDKIEIKKCTLTSNTVCGCRNG